MPPAGAVPPEAAPAPVAAPKPTQTAEVKKEPPPAPNRYKVDHAGFMNAIRATPEFQSQAGMFGSMVPDATIVNGFNSDERVKAAGVRYDAQTGTMHFKNPNDPQVKEVMKDFDTKKFMTPIEEKKKEVPVEKKVEPPKPTPVPEKKPEAPAPAASIVIQL